MGAKVEGGYISLGSAGTEIGLRGRTPPLPLSGGLPLAEDPRPWPWNAHRVPRTGLFLFLALPSLRIDVLGVSIIFSIDFSKFERKLVAKFIG